MIRHFLSKQFAVFLLVGGVAAVLHWLSRIALSNWLPFPSAVAIAYLAGVTIAFILNSALVFPNSAKPRTLQAVNFFIVNLVFFPVIWLTTILINNALLSAGMRQNTQEVSHGIAVLIPAFATFLIYKFFAFKDTRHEQR